MAGWHLDTKMAQDIVARTMRIIDTNINVMDARGRIIGSGDRERIGELHEGALLVLSQGRVVDIDDAVARHLQRYGCLFRSSSRSRQDIYPYHQWALLLRDRVFHQAQSLRRRNLELYALCRYLRLRQHHPKQRFYGQYRFGREYPGSMFHNDSLQAQIP